jgi:hypothetical protein
MESTMVLKLYTGVTRNPNILLVNIEHGTVLDTPLFELVARA